MIDPKEVARLVAECERIEAAKGTTVARRFIDTLFPEDGPLSRHCYPKHMQFFKAGKTHRERLFMAANRIGKTLVGCYECTCHLTGDYPHWWEGRRFDHPVSCWAAGKTNETTRDIIQAKLLGRPTWLGKADRSGMRRKTLDGTGLLPGRALGEATWKQGVSDLVDTIKIRHSSGGWSTLGLKAYQQGRGSFEGTEQHIIWCDEEPPLDVYSEMLIRTMTTNGLVMVTFTPLEGWSEVVGAFLESPTQLLEDINQDSQHDPRG